MKSAVSAWLVRARGEKVLKVQALIFLYEGDKNLSNPQEIYITLSSGETGKFRCRANGASLELSDQDIREYDMGGHGRLAIEDLSFSIEWKDIVGKNVINTMLVYSHLEGCFIGFKLDFDENRSVSILNLGDEMYVFQEVPNSIISEEELTFSSTAVLSS